MIKNPDGSDYLINKPDSTMFGQELWVGPIELINIGNNTITIEDFNKSYEKHDIEKSEVKEEVADTIHKPLRPIDLIKIWCRPAIKREKTSITTGEKSYFIEYGEDFIFMGKILEFSDFQIKIQADSNLVTTQSIIFPQNKQKRWWRIVEYKDGIITGVISKDNIAFSEPIEFSD